MKESARSDKRAANLSKDTKWRSFPRVPNLVQYVSTGTYYGRLKTNGKLIRRSLETNVWSTTKLRLVDFLKQGQEAKPQVDAIMFREAVERYHTEIRSNVSMKKTSKDYLLKQCLRKIELSWPDLWTQKIESISEDKCLEWAARLNKEISSQYFNNTIIVLKRILEIGIAEQIRRGGNEIPNPTRILTRARVSQRPPELREPDQFRRMVESIRMRSGDWGQRAADLIEFLAYSGMRLESEILNSGIQCQTLLFFAISDRMEFIKS